MTFLGKYFQSPTWTVHHTLTCVQIAILMTWVLGLIFAGASSFIAMFGIPVSLFFIVSGLVFINVIESWENN